MNISFYLGEHGWSTCRIIAKEQIHEITISHIFLDNPIEACISSLEGIIRGEKIREFYWYGEPGGERITIEEIPTKRNMVNLIVEGFTESYGKEIQDFKRNIEIEIGKKQLIRIFYFEYKKTSELLKDAQYEENRQGYFPFQRFKKFENLATEYIELQ